MFISPTRSTRRILFCSALTLAVLLFSLAQWRGLKPAAAAPVFTCAPPPAGLVSWWPLDGNANDIAGGNSGVIEGSGHSFPAAEVNQGFKSGGQASVVRINDNSSLDLTTLTIEAWVRVDANNLFGMDIVWKGNNTGATLSGAYTLFVQGTGSLTDQGKLGFTLSDGVNFQTMYSTAVIPVGVLTHIAATASGSEMKLYLNGVLDRTVVQTVTPQNNANPLQIGSESNAAANNFFNGVIDELALYNRALTVSEIQSIVAAGSAGKCVNTPPVIIAGATITRQQGTAGSAATLSTVSDDLTAAGNISVTATTVPAGLSVTNIGNSGGTITATVAAGCTAAVGDNTVVLTATDGNNASATANFIVTVTANTLPTLSYGNQSITAGSSTTVSPATASDNGSITGYGIVSVSPALNNAPTVNASGVVAISNAAPTGLHTITVRATDNCGATNDASFTLTVNCPVMALSPNTLPAGITGVPYNQSLSTTGGTGAVSYSLNGGSALPGWLMLSAAGVLSGMPPQAGNASFTIRATDSNGCVGLRSYALSWAFVIGGMPVTTVGQAQVTLGPDGSVLISGLNNPGLNGYTIQLGQATGAGVTLEPAADLRPNGNTIAMQTHGQINGLAGQVIATASFTGNGMDVIHAVDFSGIGSTQSLFQLYGATGNLLLAFVGPNLSPLTIVGGASPYTTAAKSYYDSRSNTAKATFVDPKTVRDASNLPTPNVTEISVTALNPTALVNFVSSATVLAHMDQGTIAASHPAVGAFGLPFESAQPLLPGQTQTAILSAGPSGLTVSNIGSSELDGVSIMLGDAGATQALEALLAAFQAGAIAAGSKIVTKATGTVNGTPNQTLGMLKSIATSAPLRPTTTPKQAQSTPVAVTSEIYTVTADFGVIPSATQRVQVYNNGALVIDIPGHTGAVGTTSAWPIGFGQRVAANGGNRPNSKQVVGLPGFIASYPASTVFTINNTNYTGDELRVTAEGSGVTIDGLDSVSLTAADISEFTITDVQVVPINNPPTIAAATVARQQGSPAASATIANVNDTEDAENTLSIKVNNATSATVNSVTISGLSVNSAGGVTANVVAACGATNASFALTVTDSGGSSVSANLNVTVTANPPPTLGYGSPQTVGIGQALTITPISGPSDNGSINSIALLSAGGYTGGLTVNSTTGVVGLTNAAPGGAFVITIRATDQCGAMADATFTLNLNCPAISLNPAALSNGTVGAAYNQTVSGVPAGSYGYSVTSGTLPNGLTLNASTGALSGTPTQAGTYAFRVTAAVGLNCSGFRDYTIVIACPAITLGALSNATVGTAYNQAITVSPAGSYSFALVVGNLPNGLVLNPSTGVLSGTPLVTGTFNFTLRAQAANGCSATQVYALAITCPTVTLSPASLPNGTTGTAYSQSITASPAGGNYTFAVTSGALPAGLALNPATGVLSGTPTANGSATFTVTATGFGGCTGSRSYTVAIGNGGCPTITLPTSLPKGSVGQLYSQTIIASPPASYSYGLTGTLPPGVSFYNAAGLLFGYPTAAGSYTFTITATSNGCSASQSYTVLISTNMAALALRNDYDGDGKSDLALLAANGEWRIQRSGEQQAQTLQWGTTGDVSLSGDYDGDGKTDIAVFRPANGTWYVKRSSDGSALVKAWGLATDVPVPGDYDGDGKTDIAVFRRSGTWFVNRSSNGSFLILTHGQQDDIPVPADYDGDGKTDLAIFRPGAIAPAPNWIILNSSTNTVTSIQWGAGYAPYFDTPVPADYDGDGKADLAIWRGADSIWYIRKSSDGGFILDSWGANYAPYFDIPTPGDYDGDGKADIAVWRRSGTWFVKRSSNGSFLIQNQGQSGDIPVPAYGMR